MPSAHQSVQSPSYVGIASPRRSSAASKKSRLVAIRRRGYAHCAFHSRTISDAVALGAALSANALCTRRCSRSWSYGARVSSVPAAMPVSQPVLPAL